MRILEMRVLRVHAHADIVVPGTHHVDTTRWSPLLYVFRQYFGTGTQLGRNFRAET
jgi:flavin reductase (DIM6/NTAB) family NADH-FMN oxidoreductase RutF